MLIILFILLFIFTHEKISKQLEMCYSTLTNAIGAGPAILNRNYHLRKSPIWREVCSFIITCLVWTYLIANWFSSKFIFLIFLIIILDNFNFFYKWFRLFWNKIIVFVPLTLAGVYYVSATAFYILAAFVVQPIFILLKNVLVRLEAALAKVINPLLDFILFIAGNVLKFVRTVEKLPYGAILGFYYDICWLLKIFDFFSYILSFFFINPKINYYIKKIKYYTIYIVVFIYGHFCLMITTNVVLLIKSIFWFSFFYPATLVAIVLRITYDYVCFFLKIYKYLFLFYHLFIFFGFRFFTIFGFFVFMFLDFVFKHLCFPTTGSSTNHPQKTIQCKSTDAPNSFFLYVRNFILNLILNFENKKLFFKVIFLILRLVKLFIYYFRSFILDHIIWTIILYRDSINLLICYSKNKPEKSFNIFNYSTVVHYIIYYLDLLLRLFLYCPAVLVWFFKYPITIIVIFKFFYDLFYNIQTTSPQTFIDFFKFFFYFFNQFSNSLYTVCAKFNLFLSNDFINLKFNNLYSTVESIMWQGDFYFLNIKSNQSITVLFSNFVDLVGFSISDVSIRIIFALTLMSSYVFLILVVALILASIPKILSQIDPSIEKKSAYECGFDPFFINNSNIEVHYIIVAFIFLIFDMELLFLTMFIVNIGIIGDLGVFIVSLYTLTIFFMLYVEWKSGALSWPTWSTFIFDDGDDKK